MTNAGIRHIVTKKTAGSHLKIETSLKLAGRLIRILRMFQIGYILFEHPCSPKIYIFCVKEYAIVLVCSYWSEDPRDVIFTLLILK